MTEHMDKSRGSVPDQATCGLCGALLVPGQERCRMCGSISRSAAPRRSLELGNKFAWLLDRFFFQISMLFAIGAIAAIAFYVIPAPLMFGPGMRLFMVLGILFFASAMLVMLDARLSGRDTHLPVSGRNPVRWFGFTLICWFVALPLYLNERPAPNYDAQRWRARAAAAATGAVLLISIIGAGSIVYRHHEFKRDQRTLKDIIEYKQEEMMRTMEGTRQ